MRTFAIALATLTLSTAATAGVTLPASEDFNGGAANWFDAAGSSEVNWASSGGFDGSGYATTSYTVPDPVPSQGATLFRAQDEFGSSGGAFEGNWIGSGVTELSFWIRHDAAAPINIFARVAGPGNFPGAVLLSFAPVLPNTWTQVTFDISPSNSGIIYEGPSDYFNVFGDVGHLQVGINPTDPLIGSTFNVDLDQVNLVPAPSAMALLGLGVIAGRRRRRS